MVCGPNLVLTLAIYAVLIERCPVAFFALFRPFSSPLLPYSDLSPNTHGEGYMWYHVAGYTFEATLFVLVLIQ